MKIKKIVISLALALTAPLLAVQLTAAMPLSTSLPQYAIVADSKSDVCTGIGLAGSGGTCGDQGVQLGSVIKTALNIFSVVIGLLAVVMIMVAGLRFITAGGESGKVAGARSAILYAIIGLVIVVFAQAVVFFVLKNV